MAGPNMVDTQQAMAADGQLQHAVADGDDVDDELQRVLALSAAEAADQSAVSDVARRAAADGTGRSVDDVDDELEIQRAIHMSMQDVPDVYASFSAEQLPTAAAAIHGAVDAPNLAAMELAITPAGPNIENVLQVEDLQQAIATPAEGSEAQEMEEEIVAGDVARIASQGSVHDQGQQPGPEVSPSSSLTVAQQEHRQMVAALNETRDLDEAAAEAVRQAEVALHAARQHAIAQKAAREAAEGALQTAETNLVRAHTRVFEDNEATIRNLRARVDQQEDRTACAVCMEADRSITLRPCGHMCLCEGCAPGQHICPICRADITERIRSVLS